MQSVRTAASVALVIVLLWLSGFSINWLLIE